jgi:hypothetical protein
MRLTSCRARLLLLSSILLFLAAAPAAAQNGYSFLDEASSGICRGGLGPDRLDALTPLINWVDGGRAPDRVVASQEDGGAIVPTRRLCPYPEVARPTGSGSASEAASFVCRDP